MTLGLTLILLVGLAGGAPVLAESETEIEACLAEGEILRGAEELIGLTKPLKLEIDCGGRRQKAVFKSLDIHKQGLYRLADGSREFNFSDCYKYERAAYLLDRELGLHMVPVAVLRTYRATDGVLIAWVSDAVNGKQVSSRLGGAKLASLERQKSIMRMFDSLIYNIDRRPENFLVDESTGELHLIDHSQAFREKTELQVVFEENRVWLSEEIYSRLQALNDARLAELTAGLISAGQHETLLARRDLIIAKIDRDRSEYGDDVVFVDPDR